MGWLQDWKDDCAEAKVSGNHESYTRRIVRHFTGEDHIGELNAIWQAKRSASRGRGSDPAGDWIDDAIGTMNEYRSRRLRGQPPPRQARAQANSQGRTGPSSHTDGSRRSSSRAQEDLMQEEDLFYAEYEVLGLRGSESPAEVRRAWTELCRLLHPDANPSVTNAQRAEMEELLKYANAAYTVLRSYGRAA